MSGIVGALQESVLETPLSQLARDELEVELIKFGSFCSIAVSYTHLTLPTKRIV